MYGMKPILRKVDTGQNFSFSVREDVFPFLYRHWHYHPEAELTYIRKGTGMRLVGDHMEHFENGDFILLGPNIPHLWRSDALYFKGDTELHIEAIAIHFRENFWGDDFLQLPELQPVKKLLEQSGRGLKITGKSKNKLIPKMEFMLRAKGAQRIECLLHMLQQIAVSKDYSFLASAGFAKTYDFAKTDKINLIYAYTFDNFQTAISIKEIASIVNISPHSFCRYFKTRTLKTYWQFLLEVRIGFACKLLIENKMSVAQVCYECGFNNLSNFNRHFKHMLGVTPHQYLKTHVQVTDLIIS